MLGIRELALLEPGPRIVHSNIRKAERQMKAIDRLLNGLEQYFYRAEVRRMEAYLSQAQNLPDLEQRMRALDKRSGFFFLP